MSDDREYPTDPEEPIDLTGGDKRTTIDDPRLSELVEMYDDLGFEVLLRPPSKGEMGEECGECLLADPSRYRTIYTRRPYDEEDV